MKNIKKHIITSAIFLCCTVFTISAITVLSRRAEENAVPVLSTFNNEPPIIVLDAGHGG